MVNHASQHYLFVIDTDTYAGAFDRQMTALCTGCIDASGRGEDEERDYHETFGGDDLFDDGLLEVIDEDGYPRICSMYENPAWFNDGYGHHYRVDDHPTEAGMVRTRLERALSIARESRDPNLLERKIAVIEAEHAGMIVVPHWPAYLSLAIHLDALPTREQEQRIHQRAIAYAARNHINIEGFRLLRVITNVEEIWNLRAEHPAEGQSQEDHHAGE